MRRIRMTGAALLAAGICGIGIAIAADSGPVAAPAYDLRAAGDIQVDNSRSGLAILSAPALAPGGSASGSVTLTNSSSAAGGLRLAQTVRSELAGAGGELILDSLLLEIGGPEGTSVYSGPARAMGSAILPEISPGESRTYSFTVSLPSTAGDPLQHASASLDYAWTATSNAGADPLAGIGVPAACAIGKLGTRDSDVLTGTEGGDRIAGRRGDDWISTLGGADCLTGGRGNDWLFGGTGDDKLKGGAGDDRLAGDAGRDVVVAGVGADMIRARDRAPDSIRCGTGLDTAIVDLVDRVTGCERVRAR